MSNFSDLISTAEELRSVESVLASSDSNSSSSLLSSSTSNASMVSSTDSTSSSSEIDQELADAFAALREVVVSRRPNCDRKMDELDIMEEMLDLFLAKEKQVEECEKKLAERKKQMQQSHWDESSSFPQMSGENLSASAADSTNFGNISTNPDATSTPNRCHKPIWRPYL